jgi:hypothetical protein
MQHNLGGIIKRVQFELHETFANPKRVSEHAPYTVEEMGWGEFEVIIRIYFRDSTQRPIELSHFLKLYGDGDQPVATSRLNPLVHEVYDEIIFPSLRDGPKEGSESAEFHVALAQHAQEVLASKGWKQWEEAGVRRTLINDDHLNISFWYGFFVCLFVCKL